LIAWRISSMSMTRASAAAATRFRMCAILTSGAERLARPRSGRPAEAAQAQPPRKPAKAVRRWGWGGGADGKGPPLKWQRGLAVPFRDTTRINKPVWTRGKRAARRRGEDGLGGRGWGCGGLEEGAEEKQGDTPGRSTGTDGRRTGPKMEGMRGTARGWSSLVRPAIVLTIRAVIAP
jgi:hypothetical protein